MKSIKSYRAFLNEDFSSDPTKTVAQKPFSIHDKKPGDVVNVDDKEVVIIKFLAWAKDKGATCTRFDGKLGNGSPVTVVLDGSYKFQ